jgi:hypothetical protein
VLTAKLDAFAFELSTFLSTGQTLRSGTQAPAAAPVRNLNVASAHR